MLPKGTDSASGSVPFCVCSAYCLHPLISPSLLAFSEYILEASRPPFSLGFLCFPYFEFPVLKGGKANIELELADKPYLCFLIVET